MFLDTLESMEYARARVCLYTIVHIHNMHMYILVAYTHLDMEQPLPPPLVAIDLRGRQNSINFTVPTLSTATVKIILIPALACRYSCCFAT